MNASSNLTVVHNAEESVVNFEGEIGEIRLDGKRLSDIHDLATKIDKMSYVIRALALTATFLAVVAVAGISAIGAWLASNHEQIANTMDTTQSEITKLTNSNLVMGQKLKSLGWEWKDGGWQQIGNSHVNPSK